MERTQYRRKQKKPAMPPIGHLLLLLALIAVVLVVCITLARKAEVPAEDPQTPESGGAETQAPLPKGNWKPIEMPEGSLAQGDLVLVNAANGFEPSASLVTVYSQKTDSYFVKDTELSVDSRIMLPLNEWMDAFREATGIDNVNIVAGYRTKDYQQKLYDNAVATKGKATVSTTPALPSIWTPIMPTPAQAAILTAGASMRGWRSMRGSSALRAAIRKTRCTSRALPTSRGISAMSASRTPTR